MFRATGILPVFYVARASSPCILTTPVPNPRQRFVEQGMDTGLERKKQKVPSRKRIIDGQSEARLISIACSTPPKGCAKWIMQMNMSVMAPLCWAKRPQTRTNLHSIVRNELISDLFLQTAATPNIVSSPILQ